jgi:dTDP-4-amino-4,6-dideoxy-D-glucose acyltransferase
MNSDGDTVRGERTLDNIFFDVNRLRHLGRNVILGKTVRIRYPELVRIGDNCILDDFTYISTALVLEANVHISAGCKLIGGQKSLVTMAEFSTLAPNVVLAAGSDDYIGGIATPLVPLEYKGKVELGKIEIGRHCIVGSGSVVLPNVVFEEGAAVGALSLVKSNLEAWKLYAGIPVQMLRERDKDAILAFERAFRAEQR